MGITLVEPEAVKTVALQRLTEAAVDVTFYAMGEAAGRAAKMAVRAGVTPAAIDVGKLQAELIAKGAYLRGPEEAVLA